MKKYFFHGKFQKITCMCVEQQFAIKFFKKTRHKLPVAWQHKFPWQNNPCFFWAETTLYLNKGVHNLRGNNMQDTVRRGYTPSLMTFVANSNFCQSVCSVVCRPPCPHNLPLQALDIRHQRAICREILLSWVNHSYCTFAVHINMQPLNVFVQGRPKGFSACQQLCSFRACNNREKPAWGTPKGPLVVPENCTSSAMLHRLVQSSISVDFNPATSEGSHLAVSVAAAASIHSCKKKAASFATMRASAILLPSLASFRASQSAYIAWTQEQLYDLQKQPQTKKEAI